MRHSGRKALPRKASPNHTQEPWPRGWHIPPRLPMAPSLELLLSPLPPPAPAILPNSTSGTSFRLPSPFPHSCLPLPHVLLPHLQASLVAFRTVSPTPGLGCPLPADLALNVSISHSAAHISTPVAVSSVVLPHASGPPQLTPAWLPSLQVTCPQSPFISPFPGIPAARPQVRSPTSTSHGHFM